MNMDSKKLNKIPANRIQIYIITKSAFIPLIEFNIYKSKNVINHKNGHKAKSHMIISIAIERVFEEIQHVIIKLRENVD